MAGTGRRGQVEKSANGSWCFIVDTAPVGAPRRQVRRRGFPTRKAAQAALTELLAAVATQTYVTPSRLTLADYVETRWLPAVEGELKPSTFRSYRRNLRLHVLRVLGRSPLQAVDAGALTALYQQLGLSGRKDHLAGTPLSATTIRYIHTIVHSALGTAVEWDLVSRNAAARAKPPRPGAQGNRHEHINVWPREVAAQFLDSTRVERLHPLWLLLATTGLRRGEALGLRWDCVDLDASRISIRRSLVDVDRGQPVWSDPKTARGSRVIALDAGTVDRLRVWRARQLEERLVIGPAYQDLGLVYSHRDGAPLHPDVTSKTFVRTVRQLGLPRIRLHDLRHTWATLALEAGVHPKVVQERLGHATVSITLDLYSHVSPAMATDAADRVAALILTR